MPTYNQRNIENAKIRAQERFEEMMRKTSGEFNAPHTETVMGLAFQNLPPEVHDQLRATNPQDYEVVSKRFGGRNANATGY